MNTKFLFPLCCIILGSSLIPSARAQGTAFTYQGRLNDGASAAPGIYDLRFAIYDALASGSQIGGTLTSTATGVSNGLFAVTLDFGGGVFPGAARWLEIGVRTNGGGAFTTLIPRQPLTATPYAVTAGAVTGPINGSSIVNGSISSAQLASGAVAAANIASNSITASQLASGAAAANLNVISQSGVASGGLVLSATENIALVNAGYVRIGTTTTADAWQQRVNGTPPAARYYHTAVWTGSEMLVWGGYGASFFNDGGRYNPAGNSWTAMTTTGAPAARQYHTAVWTGSEMLVWGGYYFDGAHHYFNDGGRYNPAGNSWTAVTTAGAPGMRELHTAVWTGSEMLVWGGRYFNGSYHYLNDGGRFNPAGNSWSSLNTATGTPPAARASHTAVWTGSEMLVWGGDYYDGTHHYLNDGGRYNPAGNSWTAVSTNGAPGVREFHTAVWTGSEMLVWGGYNGSILNDGGRYNPAANSWTAVTTNGAPTVRFAHTAVWTGSELLVWGGANDGGALNDGGRYNPATNGWTAMTNTGTPGARYYHTAVWTGSEMLIWGGYGVGSLNDGGRYNPARDSWTAVSTSGLPTARYLHTAVWTGSEMIVWGGYNGSILNDGGRYNPAGNIWTAVSATGAPAGRSWHTAVWTGSEMIVWGGYNYSSYFNDGGRYNPAGNSWTAVTTGGAPAARSTHTAVWTGSEMIIWGGFNSAVYNGSYNDGARYSPVANSWTAVTTNGAPATRYGHTAVWTGNEMIVWGGILGPQSYSGDGGRYNPTANSWTAMTTNGAPWHRAGHTAVWTGSEMIVWGGDIVPETGPILLFNDGARYNPTANSWRAVTTGGAPAARSSHTAVWTGSEMIVWGGADNSGKLNDGGRYNPAADSWMAVTTTGAPAGRYSHTAVWTGSEMIVWGGYNGSYLNDTWSYRPGKVLYLYQWP